MKSATLNETPLIKKLKGLTVKDEDLATQVTKVGMARAIRDLEADCTGAWSGTFEQYEEKLRKFFPRRRLATTKSMKVLVKNFGKITWDQASLQLIYTGSNNYRNGVNFGHVITGTIHATGLPIKLIYRQSTSPISGQRLFKIGNHRQCSVAHIDGPNNWKRENGYIG